jgi:hypothetical protein
VALLHEGLALLRLHAERERPARELRRAADYSTDVLGRMAAQIVRTSRRPLFLVFSPAAPHAPATPARRHLNVPLTLGDHDSPAFRERGALLHDKPRYVRENWRWPTKAQRSFRIRQYRSLLAVDDAIRRITDALAARGRLRDTLIVFTSDNGVMWNEHGFTSARKAVPYEGAIRVPLVVRYDRLIRAPRRDEHLVTNADLAPTFARLGGAALATEGRNLIPLLRNRPRSPWRTRFLIENAGGEIAADRIPTWCGVRTERHMYALYATGEQELYDLQTDPHQLENRVRDAEYRPALRSLRDGLRRLCFPLPPGLQPRVLCTISGTRRGETVTGDRRRDTVCPNGGRDRVATGGGADTVHAGAVRIRWLSRLTWSAPWGGPAGSRFVLGPGADRIFARNGRRDSIRCGSGADLVVADRFDLVERNCERIVRPPETG